MRFWDKLFNPQPIRCPVCGEMHLRKNMQLISVGLVAAREYWICDRHTATEFREWMNKKHAERWENT